MAKLLGPDFISLQVRNLSASRAFYTEMLGLTIDERFNTPDFVLFDSSTIPFALSEAKMSCIPNQQPPVYDNVPDQEKYDQMELLERL
jgi:catechol 2,3-dioxygenase-like lactoylglutathione lyase family enzyme